MKCILLTILLITIFSVNVSSNSHKGFIQDVIILIQDVINLYKTSGVYLVFDKLNSNFTFVNIESILNAMSIQEPNKRLPRNFIMSQAISFDNLEMANRMSNLGSVRTPLFVVIFNEFESLHRFRVATRNIDISGLPWLALIANETGIDCQHPAGNPFNLKMNTRMIAHCWGSYSIMKFFSIFENTTEVVELAVWAPGSHLIVKNDDDVVQLQKNMKGLILKAAMLPVSPIYSKNWKDFQEQLIREIAYIANFKYKIIAEETNYGYQDYESKSWFGVMQIFAEKNADILITLTRIANTRLDIVDFTFPFFRAHTNLYAKLPNSTNIHWTAYFIVFDKYSWMTLGFTILILSIVLGLLKTHLQGPYFSTIVFGNLLTVWGIFTQQGLIDMPTNIATRILCFWALVSSTFIHALYSASITSYITVMTTSLPFSSTDEFLHSDYTLYVLNGSRDEDLILHDDPAIGILKDHLGKSEDMPAQVFEGFCKACEDKIAYYSDEVNFAGTNRMLIPCTLGNLQLIRIEWLSLALSKNSPYTETLNYYILRLMNTGITHRLKIKYFYELERVPDSMPNVMTLQEVLPLISIWMIGVIAAFLVFGLEIFVRNYIRRIESMKVLMKNNLQPRITWNP